MQMTSSFVLFFLEEKREVCSAARSCDSCTPSVIGAIVITILLILIVACAVINRGNTHFIIKLYNTTVA